MIDREIMRKYEVLIIDDGSTDQTPIIAERYMKKFPYTYQLIKKENGGWGSTINMSLQLAKGKYFKVLDADDYFEKEHLEKFIQTLESTEADLILTAVKTMNYENGELISEEDVAMELGVEYGQVYNGLRKMCMEMHHCTFKTEKLKQENYRLLEKCYYTDVEYLLKSIKSVESYVAIEQVTYCYCLNRVDQSINMEQMKLRYKEHLRVIEQIVEFYNDNQLCANRTLIQQRLETMIVHQYLLYLYMTNKECCHNEREAFDDWISKQANLDYRNIKKRVKRKVVRIGAQYLMHPNKWRDRQDLITMRNWIEICISRGY